MAKLGDVILREALASRPAAGTEGRLFYDTTNSVLYRDSGTEWESVEGEGGSGAGDAADLTYTPAVATDWDSDTDPGNTNDALDQLAERVDDLEAAGGGGGSTNTQDAFASRPAAGTVGNLFFPTDGYTIDFDAGA